MATLRSGLAVGFALLVLGCGSESATPTEAASGDECPEGGEEWEEARLYIEHNATDEDTGVHGFFGGEAWRELCVTDPAGTRIWLVDPQNQLGDLGVSDFFFESREPENDEYTVDDLLADFPEGDYTVSGTDFEGTPRSGTARFTHAIPAPPEISAPALFEEPEEVDEDLDAGDVVVTWDPVTETIDGELVEIVSYEVIVTKEEHDDPDALSQPIYDVHVPADVTSLPVPEEFFEPGTVYELEVLALEASGNQTIALGFFRVA